MRVIFLFMVFLSGWPVMAGTVRVEIKSGAEPLGYAFVFVNGRFAASADSLGVACLPDETLREGDTISASFLGARNFALYRPAGVPTTIDIASGLEIDKIEVTSQRVSRNFLLRHVTPRATGSWYWEHTYNCEITGDDLTLHRGACSLTLIPYSHQAVWGDGFAVTPLTDTTGCGNVFLLSIDFANQAIMAVSLHQWFTQNDNWRIRYLGERDGRRMFFIARPYFAGGRYGWQCDHQTLLEVDAGTKEIVAARVSLISASHGFQMDFMANYKLVNYEKGEPKGTYLCPAQVKGRYTRKGRSIDMSLTDIELIWHKWPRPPSGGYPTPFSYGPPEAR